MVIKKTKIIKIGKTNSNLMDFWDIIPWLIKMLNKIMGDIVERNKATTFKIDF
jgi:hypothetical protein